MAGRNSPFCCWLSLPCAACSTPFLWCLPKETGWSPKERRLGWWRPREVSGPTRLSHSRGSCHSAAKVSASRTDWITRPRGEGLGLAEVWPSKSFLPRFFTKKRAGSRGGALAARRSARNAPFASQSAGGGQRGNPRRGFPLCGRRSRPQPMRIAVTPVVDEGKGRRGRRPLRRVGDGPCAT